MSDITLHRAGRTLEAIRVAIGRLAFEPTGEVSIFGDPVAERARSAEALLSEVDRLDKLLAVQSRIRAAVGRANAELGIGDALAEKAAIEEWIKLAGPLVAGRPAKPAGIDLLTRRGREVVSDAAILAERATAMRARFAASDAEVGAVVAVRYLDDAAIDALSGRIARRRRDVERLADRLRELNGRAIAIDEADLAWLRSEDII